VINKSVAKEDVFYGIWLLRKIVAKEKRLLLGMVAI